jgi:hypothetical protein
MQGCPRHPGPLVSLLVEGFHLHGMHSFGQWRDRKSIVTDPHNQPINFSSPCVPHVRGPGVRCGRPRHPGPLVKLLDSIAPAACIRLVVARS